MGHHQVVSFQASSQFYSQSSTQMEQSVSDRAIQVRALLCMLRTHIARSKVPAYMSERRCLVLTRGMIVPGWSRGRGRMCAQDVRATGKLRYAPRRLLRESRY